MKNLGLLGARLVLGGYLAVHGAQKLFGSFGGRGLEATSVGFESIGLRPGKAMAAMAGGSEFGGGILTATGIAYPLGPIMIMGAMIVATVTHRSNGPLSSKGGFELPLINLAAAAALAATGPGALRLGPSLSPRLTRRVAVAGVLLGGPALYQLLNAPKPEPKTGETEDETGETEDETGETEDETA